MAFGIDRKTLMTWKNEVSNGNIAIITHYWLDDRFPGCKTVTKVGCSDYQKLIRWGGKKYGLRKEWIHHNPDFPHFDLFGEKQKQILEREDEWEQINKFNL
ncbi:hypothetical protein JCM21714_454 [Gracilibacillus boraciitolerans JCM 21714]|uniref:Uncharacterized protein n=1 Tax=Gracilibacillus boraciitolerans JCM 21714 TaxID=1298598 RepID=W4VFG9_9BACI|nr:hypothetical protein [Gracilibacillus boraciitolerans]GAE91504.1 hypothetical protein JCM21714_454 [Gracilibacillus boraciitolerans JCM 21714]